ncbi:DUF2510 domain-containing protein [Gordonia sp. SL306]|uniref:DUF2510 domain-containing protein n=1 Tax=Gordonia sp. SL306 TaxID=2995145 RepID=UPI00226F3914|nr:DUF2510 domain-containing protein [Gordonia sp. SL306]WAC54978.1 DUF2510 domain-containing protein [Gordonia sp. SL306]
MSQPSGWYPDPQRQTLQRYWDGEQWTDQVKSTKKGPNWRYLLAIGVIVVAVIVVASIAGGGGDDGDSSASPPPTTTTNLAADRTSQATVLAAAEKLCADMMREKFVDPDADFGNWKITAENPAGTTPPSWRVFGQMSTGSTPRGFYCDVAWQAAADNYHAELVG